jgi:hypothetical protein
MRALVKEGGKHFFSEEKKQKTFIFGSSRQDPVHGLDRWRGGEKVFCFFSSEKKDFLT